MKMISFNVILILLSIFILVINGPCQYEDFENGERKMFSTNASTLESIKGKDDNDVLNQKKQKCFSYSNSDVFENQCCYSPSTNECYAREPNDNGDNCPKNSIVFNNCGMAGIYQPMLSDKCTEISLVQGYCCYVAFEDNSSACLRTKELNKDINSTTKQMFNYLDNVKEYYKGLNSSLSDSSLKIKEVVCEGYNLKNYWLFLILAVISLF